MFRRTVRTGSSEGPGPRRWTAVVGIAALTATLLVAGLLLSPARSYAAATPVALGTAGTYLVLGGTGVTNTGATVLSGDLGVSPATAIVGFPPGIVAGATHAGDPQAAQAQTDLLSAYNDAAARVPTALDFAGDQNGKTFTPGVYHTAAAFALTGTLTLDGGGDPNAVFIFQVGAALNTAAGSTVSLVNGARASHVFWQVLGAAGTGASSSFSGTIMALGAITVGAGAAVTGRALSRGGLVTLSTNTFTFTNTAPPVVAITGGAAASTNTPTPTITGTTSAAIGTTVTVTVAGQTLSTTVQTGGAWSVTATALTEGPHTVRAQVTDPGGNKGSASQSLTVDITAPVVSITGGATASTNTSTPTITGTTDAAAGTTVIVTVAGQTLTTTVQAGGTWSVTAAALTEGPHTMVAQVTDPAGNTGTANQTLTVDTTIALVALGTAGTYLVLGGTGVTNTGATVLSGDLGVSPATAIVGFPPGIVAGATHAGDPQAAQAQTDLLAAYNDAAARVPTALDFAGDQNGKTFTPGVYHTTTAFALTGTLTLDGRGDPNAVFIFQVGAALNTAAGSTVSLVNGAQASHIFWQVLGAAGTGASSSFSGTIMALGAITVGAGAAVTGRALSHGGLVTLSTNTFTFPGGVLGISAPSAKDMGTGTAAGTLTAQLGSVTATDNRGQSGAGWTAQASSTVFSNTTTPAAAPITTVTYASGPSTSTTGTAVFLPGQTTTPSALSSTAVTAFSASATGGNNSVTWNPTVVVNLPAQAITGSYTGTITHSVS